MTLRIDESLVAELDAAAEGRGGRSVYVRQLIASAVVDRAKEPAIAPRTGDSERVRLVLQFTPEEMLAIDDHAEARQTTRAGWAAALVRRRLALGGPVDRGMFEALVDIRSELRRIGRNVNQATRAANAANMADSGLSIGREVSRIADMKAGINEQIAAIGPALDADAAYWEVPD